MLFKLGDTQPQKHRSLSMSLTLIVSAGGVTISAVMVSVNPCRISEAIGGAE